MSGHASNAALNPYCAAVAANVAPVDIASEAAWTFSAKAFAAVIAVDIPVMAL